jgi:hypothetical protein
MVRPTKTTYNYFVSQRSKKYPVSDWETVAFISGQVCAFLAGISSPPHPAWFALHTVVAIVIVIYRKRHMPDTSLWLSPSREGSSYIHYSSISIPMLEPRPCFLLRRPHLPIIKVFLFRPLLIFFFALHSS